MSPIDTTKVRWSLVRDAQGRDLFVPWLPFSRAAYVLPDPTRRGALEQRVRRRTAIGLAALVAGVAIALFLDWPVWSGLLIGVAVSGYWYASSWLASRGLERTRYEPVP